MEWGIIISAIAILISVYGAFVKKPKEQKIPDYTKQIQGLIETNIGLKNELNNIKKELEKKPDVVKDDQGNYSFVHGSKLINKIMQ